MGRPKVIVELGSSNLGITAADASGVFGILASIPAAPTAGYGVPFYIKSKTQAKAAFADVNNAGILNAIIDAFYSEVSEGSVLYFICFSNTTTLAAMADVANGYVETLNNFADKKLRAVGLVRIPASSYTPTLYGGFDIDVHNAVVKCQANADEWIAKYKPIEFLIEGRNFTNATNALDYSATANKNVHIVIGSEADKSINSLLRALGKKAANPVHRNIGRVKSGSLKIADGVAVTLGQTRTETTAETKATATVTVTTVGSIYLGITELFGVEKIIATYNHDAANDTVTKVATAIKNLINGGTATHGYTAANAAGVITVTAKSGLGAQINGTLIRVILYGNAAATTTAFTGGVSQVTTFVSAKPIAEIDSAELDDLHDKGYIFYVTNEDEPGFIFSDDISLTDPTSDYSTWSHNAVIGEAMRIVYATYYRTLKDDVEVEADGTLGKAIETNLQQDVVDAIEKALAGNISGVSALVNPDVTAFAGLYENAGISNPNLNLLQGGKLYVFLTVRPRGYIKDVLVVLGFGL